MSVYDVSPDFPGTLLSKLKINRKIMSALKIEEIIQFEKQELLRQNPHIEKMNLALKEIQGLSVIKVYFFKSETP